MGVGELSLTSGTAVCSYRVYTRRNLNRTHSRMGESGEWSRTDRYEVLV